MEENKENVEYEDTQYEQTDMKEENEENIHIDHWFARSARAFEHCVQ